MSKLNEIRVRYKHDQETLVELTFKTGPVWKKALQKHRDCGVLLTIVDELEAAMSNMGKALDGMHITVECSRES